MENLRHYESEKEALEAFNRFHGRALDFKVYLYDQDGEGTRFRSSYDDDNVFGEFTSMESLDRTLGNTCRKVIRTGKKPVVLVFGWQDKDFTAINEARAVMAKFDGRVAGIAEMYGEPKIISFKNTEDS